MTCLLCQDPIEDELKLLDLVLISPSRVSICSACREGFEVMGNLNCPACCKKGSLDLCSDCLYWQAKGQEVSHRALYAYNEAMKAYFKAYKFHGDYLLRMVFGPAIKEALKSYKGYAILPVPVSQDTLVERGFNQVEGLLEAAGVSYQSLLGKKERVKQSHLGRAERLALKNDYYLLEGREVPARILLVDDVYTTGSTLQSIVALLYEKGVKEVKTFSLAR